MMKNRHLVIILTVLLITLACSIPGLDLEVTDTPEPATVIETQPTLTPNLDIPALTIEQLRNAEYRLSFYPGETRIIKLENGEYQQGSDPTNPDFAAVTMNDLAAFGDLDGDEVDDAVVMLAEHYGGSGVFVSLAAVLNKGGLPAHSASVMIGDRAIIDTLAIKDGEIHMTGAIHGFQDAMCCPTFKVAQAFNLSGQALVLTHFTSFTPGDEKREIDIVLPVSGWEVTNVLNISGSVTISPFENNLELHIYDRDSKEIYVSPLMVDSDGMGSPGTFAVSVDLNALNYAGPILVTLSENSMADGSLLMLDSVWLEVK